jgi:hypothetical protein
MAIEQRMSRERTKDVIERYVAAAHGDVGMMSPDVVFRIMATGDEYRTPDRVKAMLERASMTDPCG